VQITAIPRVTAYRRTKQDLDLALDQGAGFNRLVGLLRRRDELNDDQRAALWLYAWHACVDGPRARQLARSTRLRGRRDR
jgi:hypothetical protein